MERKAEFLSEFGDSYGYPSVFKWRNKPNGSGFEAFVSREIGGRLKGDAYLDWAASALYTDTQVDEMANELKSNLFGNPHSLSESATRSSDEVEAARLEILDYLGASSDEYEIIFTRSCTDSLRLVADTFPWAPGGEFKYLVQNHNSVLGIRDVARKEGASASAIEAEDVPGFLDSLEEEGQPSLFAFPGEENFAGGMFPMEWTLRRGRDDGDKSRWRFLVDGAKLTASHPVNLTKYPVDFFTLSFYKLFGSPTGVGALVVRQSLSDELNKCYWGGGSVSVAGVGRSTDDDVHVLKSRLCERFEDGTVSFLGIAALKHGFRALKKVGGPEAIERHTAALTQYLDRRLRALRHTNGAPLLIVYGDPATADTSDGEHRKKGPVVNFNVLEDDGVTQISHIDAMAAAAEAGIHIRAGAQCNPGAAQEALGLPSSAVHRLATDESIQGCGMGPAFIACPPQELSFGEYGGGEGGPVPSEIAYGSDDGSSIFACEKEEKDVMVPLGSVRASLGYLSTFDDVEALAIFLEETYRT